MSKSNSLYDFAIDLINEAKIAKDAKTKIFKLEQVKEIILHRDHYVLQAVIEEISNSLILDETVSVRRFLLILCAEALKKNIHVFPSVLGLYDYFSSGKNDEFTQRVAMEMKIYYEKFVMQIVGMKTKYPMTHGQGDTKKLWSQFRGVVSRIVDVVSSDRFSESTRTECLRIIENVVIFGLPAPREVGKVLDPRLLAAQRSKDTSTSGQISSNNIPLDHPLINREDLEKEAESLFSKLQLWISRGGPQGCSFSPYQMSLLGQCICNIGSARPKTSTNAAAAVIILLTGSGTTKTNICPKINGSGRKQLATATLRLLRSISAGSGHTDTDGIVPKLQNALAGLEKLGYGDAGSAPEDGTGEITEVSKKRNASEMEQGEDDFDAERAKAIEALDAVEGHIRAKLKEGGGGGAGDGIKGTSLATGGAAAGSLSNPLIPGQTSTETELSAEFALLPEVNASLKLAAIPTMGTGGAAPGEMFLRPVAAAMDCCGVLALLSLQRTLEAFYELRVQGASPKALAAHAKMCERMALTMSFIDLAGESPPLTSVPVITSLAPPQSVGRLAENIPVYVMLPKPIWFFLSFALSNHKEDSHGIAGTQSQRLDLAVSLLQDLHHRIVLLSDGMHSANVGEVTLSEENAESVERRNLQKLYENIILVSVGRLLQNSSTRALAKDLLLQVPAVSTQCLRFIKLLLHTGRAKSSAGSTTASHRSVKAEAMSLLVHLVMSEDEEAANSALNMLLWCGVGDDFEISQKVTTSLVSDILREDSWATHSAALFAVHAAISVVGVDCVSVWSEERSRERQEHDGVDAATTSVSEEEVGTEVSTTRDHSVAVAAVSHDMECSDSNTGGQHESQASVGVEDRGGGVGHIGYEGSFEVDLMAEEEHVQLMLSETTVETAAAQYDDGCTFEGTFLEAPTNPLSKFEAYAKRHLHLLSKMAILHPSLIRIFFDLEAVVILAAKREKESGAKGMEAHAPSAATSIEPSNVVSSTTPPPPPGAATVAATSVVGGTCPPSTPSPSLESSKWTVLSKLIRVELGTVVPAVASAISTADEYGISMDKLFTALSDGVDRRVQPLLEVLLDALHTDMNMPASSEMVHAVKMYIHHHVQKSASVKGVLGTSLHSNGSSGDSSTMEVTSTTEDSNASLALDYNNDAVIRLLVPVLGGLPGSEVEAMLPYLVRAHRDDVEVGLRRAFDRILKARPPPVSRSALLVGLHRIDFRAFGMEQKTMIGAIGLCVNNKEEFQSDVLRDALGKLLQDSPPSWALMRTAILSFTQHSDLKKFVLSEVVLRLARQRTWEIAPKVWDGVAFVMNKQATHKDADPSIRCLLGLPADQIKAILYSGLQNNKIPLAKVPIAALVSTPLAKILGRYLKGLVADEKEHVVSGRWAQIEPVEVTEATQVQATKAEADKAEILKQLELGADKK